MIQPHKTTLEYEVGSKRPLSELVVLTMEDQGGALGAHNGSSLVELNVKTSTSSNASSSANSIINANIQMQIVNSTSFANLISNPSPISPLGADNVWKKRNLENSVSIPQETQIKSKTFLDSRVIQNYKAKFSSKMIIFMFYLLIF